jgi:predicted Zn-dependent protease
MSRQDLEQSPASNGGASAADLIPGLRARRGKPIDPVLLERLAETGFLATEFGMDAHAQRIFTQLARLKPGKPSPRIALAMVQARRGEMDAAIAALRELLKEHADCELARAVLGSMLLHIGAAEAREVLEGVIARAADPGAVSVAESCLEQARAAAAPAAAREERAIEFFRHHNIRA